MPTVSDKDWAWQRDPGRQIWVYRSGTNPPVVLDWASSLLPYRSVLCGGQTNPLLPSGPA